MSRLVAAPRRIEFVCLRTDPSPQIALHLASQRRSYLRLRSLWLPPTWTLTMLIWRLHGRTHSDQRSAKKNPCSFFFDEPLYRHIALLETWIIRHPFADTSQIIVAIDAEELVAIQVVQQKSVHAHLIELSHR